MGLSGASKRVAVTFFLLLEIPMSPIHGWVFWALENNFLTKELANFQQARPTPSTEININPSQQLERSDQEFNVWPELGG